MKKTKVDTALLIQMLKMTQPELKLFMYKELKKSGYKPVHMDGFVFAEGEDKVALVAHMDTVYAPPKYVVYKDGRMSGKNGLGADDRAGCYGILQLIAMGHKPTVILLEDEELGCVGASKFVQAKPLMDVMYIIELDRQGSDDCVFYDCDNEEFTMYIESFGFKENMGSFSDISVIAPAYGVSAVNLSVGYYMQHTAKEFLIIRELGRTIDKVSKMIRNCPVQAFEYVECKHVYGSYFAKSLTSRGSSYDWTWSDSETDYGKYAQYYPSEEESLLEPSKFLPLRDCVVVFDSGEMVEVDFAEELYFIDNNNLIYDSMLRLQSAYAVNYDFYPITFKELDPEAEGDVF